MPGWGRKALRGTESKDPQDTERPTARLAARFEQVKTRRCLPMSKGCGVTVGDTSEDNPDPESPERTRGQAARKGGRERGRLDEETQSPTW